MVAVSGGADSVALLAAMTRLREANGLAAAHFNHRLRGAESDQHESFVAELCQVWGIPLVREHASRPLAEMTGGEGLESVARKARYAFLEQAATSVGARYLLTAHTADDQVETVVHRVLRGTGIAGLAGIPRIRQLSEAVSVVRPLLAVRRSAVRAYLHNRNLPWCEDASNLDPRFTRNRIRSELLPQLREHYSPHVDESILRLSRLAGETQAIIDGQVETLYRACVQHTAADDAIVLNTKAVQASALHLVRELLIRIWKEQSWPLQAMSAQRWDEIANLAGQPQSPTASLMLPGGVHVQRTSQTLVITPPVNGG